MSEGRSRVQGMDDAVSYARAGKGDDWATICWMVDSCGDVYTDEGVNMHLAPPDPNKPQFALLNRTLEIRDAE